MSCVSCMMLTLIQKKNPWLPLLVCFDYLQVPIQKGIVQFQLSVFMVSVDPYYRGMVPTHAKFGLFSFELHEGVKCSDLPISKSFSFLNPFPNKPWFLCVCSLSLLKTPGKKEKLLVTSNFSFSHSVLYLFGELSAFFIKFEIVI